MLCLDLEIWREFRGWLKLTLTETSVVFSDLLLTGAVFILLIYWSQNPLLRGGEFAQILLITGVKKTDNSTTNIFCFTNLSHLNPCSNKYEVSTDVLCMWHLVPTDNLINTCKIVILFPLFFWTACKNHWKQEMKKYLSITPVSHLKVIVVHNSVENFGDEIAENENETFAYLLLKNDSRIPTHFASD